MADGSEPRQFCKALVEGLRGSVSALRFRGQDFETYHAHVSGEEHNKLTRCFISGEVL